MRKVYRLSGSSAVSAAGDQGSGSALPGIGRFRQGCSGGTRARPGTAANMLTCDEARRIAALTAVHRESLVDS
jgi:hypothetical protein